MNDNYYDEDDDFDNDVPEDADVEQEDNEDDFQKTSSDINQHLSSLEKRRRLESLLEQKRLTRELDGYDEYLSQKNNYDDDDIY